MNKLKAKQLIEALEEAGYEPQTYSGRGMGERYCVAVIVEGSGAVADALSCRSLYKLGRDLADHDIPAPMADTMGRRAVAYWPTMPWPEDEGKP